MADQVCERRVFSLLPEFRHASARFVAIPTWMMARKAAWVCSRLSHLGRRDTIGERVCVEIAVRQDDVAGHSASFVQAWVELSPPPPPWFPSRGGREHRLLVAGEVASPIWNRDTAGLRPAMSLWQGYGTPDWCVSEQACPSSQLTPVCSSSAWKVTPGLRHAATDRSAHAVMACTPCSRRPRGSAATNPMGRRRGWGPHLAFIPLPDVGHDHANGHHRRHGACIATGGVSEGLTHFARRGGTNAHRMAAIRQTTNHGDYVRISLHSTRPADNMDDSRRLSSTGTRKRRGALPTRPACGRRSRPRTGRRLRA